MRTGRPTFQLNASRLKQMREEAKLTQAELAQEAYRLHEPRKTATATPTKNYQRIEYSGRTSKAMATALAKALNTTVGVLQGDAPDAAPNWLDDLERQLQEQLTIGGNPALSAAVAWHSGAEDPVRDLAIQVVERLERVQLGSHRSEMAQLVELTGWSEARLLRSLSHLGHWLLISTVFGSQSSVLVRGVHEVLFQIRQSFAKYPNDLDSDATVTLRDDPPWLHVDVQSSRFPARRKAFSFVRCTPTQSGLHWVNPTWRDRLWLEELLLPWAFTTANIVVGFDGQAVPGDLRALRLLVERFDGDQTAHQVALIQGDSTELSDDTLKDWQRLGGSHDLATDCMLTALQEGLAPLLTDWPIDRWRVQAGDTITIGLDPSIGSAALPGPEPDFGIKYHLRLVEEVAPGQIRPAPWRQSSVEDFARKLQRCLLEEAESGAEVNAASSQASGR